MDGPLRAWLERTGTTRAELPGLLVAATGSLLALVLALRLPLAGAVTAGTGPAPAVSAPVATPPPSPSPAVVLVRVTGAVATPGVVRLVDGDRLEDAIAAAGGALADAALAAVNLARPVVDGEHVVVPTTAEVAAGLVEEGSGPGGGAPAGELPDGRLDLNTADADQLEELPGIGPVLAARIVDRRTEVGPFDEAAALREVSGIGDAVWADVRDLVGVAGEPPP